MNIQQLAQLHNLDEIDTQLGNQFWSPVDVVTINDWILRAAAIKGEFHWHSHTADEFFFVYKGEMTIETEKGPLTLKANDCAVIPKGIEHKTTAKERTIILMLEPASVNLKGD